MTLTFGEACNQVAEKHKLGKTLVMGHKMSYIIEAVDLVLSSKDKEIESLKSDSKDWHDSYQASLKEIALLKRELEYHKKYYEETESWNNKWVEAENGWKKEIAELKENLASFNKFHSEAKQQIQSLQEEIKQSLLLYENQNQTIIKLQEEMKKKEEEIQWIMGRKLMDCPECKAEIQFGVSEEVQELFKRMKLSKSSTKEEKK